MTIGRAPKKKVRSETRTLTARKWDVMTASFGTLLRQTQKRCSAAWKAASAPFFRLPRTVPKSARQTSHFFAARVLDFGRRGNLILELGFIIFPLLMVFVLFFEILRHELYRTVIQHTAFQYVRSRAFGTHDGKAKEKVRSYLIRILGKNLGQQVYLNLDLSLEKRSSAEVGWVGKGYLRYPQFIAFQQNESERKHHMEITQKCFFPY